MVDVSLVAKYFLAKSLPKTERSITHLKLQKLIYYAQGFYSAMKGEFLFNQDLQAWVHGPVCNQIYQEYKHHGSREIPKVKEKVSICDNVDEVLDRVWNTYGSYSGSQLEYLTHRETPWKKARDGARPWESTNNDINKEDIKEYFESKLCGDS